VKKPTPLQSEKPSLGICVAGGGKDTATCNFLLQAIQTLGHRGLQPPLGPSQDQDSGAYQLEVDNVIGGCDAAILVYDRESLSWVQAQYLRAHRLLARRGRGYWGAVLSAPPPKAAGPQIADQRVMLLNCENGLLMSEVQRFVHTLTQEARDV